MKIHIRQTGSSTSEATIRGHRISIDRPLEKSGSDAGPMGGELFLAAIGGCFMSNLLAAINARKAEVSGVQTEVIATPMLPRGSPRSSCASRRISPTGNYLKNSLRSRSAAASW